jgi:hypothetical protein
MANARDVERERERNAAKQLDMETASAGIRASQERWRERRSQRADARAARLNPYGDTDKAAEQERLNASIRSVRAQEEAAAAAPDPVEDVAAKIRERGATNVAEGMKLMGMADAARSVQVRNKNYDAVKGYTDTMGAGQQVGRRGLFNPGAAQLQQPQAPVQVVVQAPGAAPPPPPAAPPEAPAGLGALPVPAAAMAQGAPGQLPQPGPDVPVPLEEEDEAVPIVVPAADDGVDYMPPEQAGPNPNDPLLQQELDAEEGVAGAAVQAANAEADALEQASARAQNALDEAAAAQAEQEERLNNQLEAQQLANKQVETLTAQQREMGAVDPRRAWKNMGTGRKIGFAIQMALTRFGGGSTADVMAPLDRYVAADVDEQVQEHAKIASDIDSARKVAGDASNLYSQTLSAVGDPDTAKAMVEHARWQQIDSEMRAAIAAANPGMVTAEQEARLQQVQQKVAEKKMIIDAKAASNPEFFTKRVPVYGKNAREALLIAGKEKIKQGVGAESEASAYEGKVDLAEIDNRAKAHLQQAKLAAKQGNAAAKEAYQFGADTERLGAVNGMIDELLEKGDIDGYGYTEGVGTPGKADTDNQIRLILDELGRIKSGGAITEEELETFSKMVMSGVTLGDGSIFEGSEARLRKNLAQVKKSLQRRIDLRKRALSKEARQHYDRNVAGADFAPIWSGDTDEQVVEED